MHLLFDDIRYSPNASSNVNYFIFETDVKFGLYEINTNNRRNAMHGPSPVQKCSKTELKRCWTGEVQDEDQDLC